VVKAGEREAVLPLVLAVDREGVALVIGTVGPLLLDAWLEGLVGIGECAACRVLGAPPRVGDRAGETLCGGVLNTDLQRVGDNACSGLGRKISHCGTEELVTDLLGSRGNRCARRRCAIWRIGGEGRGIRAVKHDAAVATDPQRYLGSGKRTAGSKVLFWVCRVLKQVGAEGDEVVIDALVNEVGRQGRLE